MKQQTILDRVSVASPCTARWDDMTGDERVRFCHHCQKSVFNLSALTQAEAEALVIEKEGKFCGRFHRRRDGRMLTADCPVGRKTRHRRLAVMLGAAAGLMTLITTAIAGGLDQRNTARGPFAQKVDDWIYDLKVRLGIVKPPMLMGAICVLPPPTPNPAPPASTNSSPVKTTESE